jgi:hypothetical protein
MCGQASSFEALATRSAAPVLKAAQPYSAAVAAGVVARFARRLPPCG